MGIYPHVHLEEKREGPHVFLIRTTTEPGLVTTEEFIRTTSFELRTDCFCCSCGDEWRGGGGRDPYCRNHGFAGKRPCEEHRTNGEPNEDGVMPASVQEERKKHG